ncbi:NAD-glutamate dehydrogenase [Gordonia jinghuaiqii]|uniref:NAD-glutamate dehydrogenase n=1 Tax=Gordonia jinghuaiqii TaxID=2758710 RepID=A0A7D7LZ42_9ACTN|nr:NAD-glutamate dehydrogenase [Gordonia jinghuaiqii]MCR5980494.1 NAD-glutamate dehydrogenase [Gordonia jinghuaiqii]QMT03338.1 NAD-glutamate dehydrogenase [Gordonia jinghuaiqii]
MTSLVPDAVNHYFRSRADGSAADSAAEQVLRHLDVARVRNPGQALVEVTVDEGGQIEIVVVNDDMPMLVEAVLATVEAHDLSIGRMDHPVMPVQRDADGILVAIDDVAEAVWESWIFVDGLAGHPGIDAGTLRADLYEVVSRVADVDHDASAMRSRMSACAAELSVAPLGESTGIRDTDRYEYAKLLEWFAGTHFHPLGYARVGSDGRADTVERLGVWRTDSINRDFPSVTAPPLLPRASRVFVSTGIQRSNFPVLLQVPAFDRHGNHDGEHRFLGTLTSAGVHQAVLDVPVLRTKVHDVLAHAGVDEDSFAGQSMIELLQNYPLVEMFSSTEDELERRVTEMLDAVATRSLRLFVRTNYDGRTAVALIYLPRDRYNTQSRLALEKALLDELTGTSLEYTARVSEMPLALLQVLVCIDPATAAELGSVDTGSPAHARMQAALTAAIRGWDERVRELATSEQVPAFDGGPEVLLRQLSSLSEDYKEQREPADALEDLSHVVGLAPGGIAVTLKAAGAVASGDGAPGSGWIFTLYLCGASATLTDVLPVLHSLGLDVLEEHPYQIHRVDETVCWAYEFSVQLTAGMSVDQDHVGSLEERFTEAFRQIWLDAAEVDVYNELVIRCGLDWRSAAMLRAYGQYLRQCGFSYSTAHVANVLGQHPTITRGLVDLFVASFDPDTADAQRRDRVRGQLREAIGLVLSLDADRIVSAFASVMNATSRTNFFVTSDTGEHRPVISLKLAPRDIPQTPKPRPLHEIFVYSPRVEGVHLRFGAVARGGLRWSDRREDFRTEVLGLVKAQAVKNAVIVPLGAKGGFVVKRPPRPTGDAANDREAHRAEGVACYRQFIAGLLDVTDNIDRATGAIIPARGVVRLDADDTYLVVAADKGTASFSDVANDVSKSYGFWLGDAFASGGSAGYDHKAMGITARGAWESVKRHFREMGTDTQSEDFTVVGIGDMSGDVFGNGMLLSEHIRLVAAFDHRHIFVDPDPRAQTSFGERKRLFELPRSSWADYDTDLISAGGGVWARDRKSIPISPEMASALGLEGGVDELSPPELIRAILLAPVDLLWNGGIGTYVKASAESDSSVGDKSNDAIRVNGDQVRAKVIGEGGNLGVTERGRIEFDLAGGRINTDALDNSAGVDCSDHEVNIKIVLDSVVSAGGLSAADRDPLLESMTDEVAELVLADNISQNSELGFCRSFSLARVEVHARMLDHLAHTRGVDLRLEALPTARELRKRVDGELHRGLTSPEFATLMAHVKLEAKADLLASDLPDNDVFAPRIARYFPEALRDRYAEAINGHRLRRQIVATTLVNDVIDHAGTTHLFRLSEGSSCSTEEGIRAYVVSNEIFGMNDIFERIRHAPAPVAAIDEMMLYTRRLLFRASRWLLAFRPQPLALAAEVTRYSARVAALTDVIDGWYGESSARDVADRARSFVDQGVPADLAQHVAVSLHRFCLLDIIDAAEIADRNPEEVGELYFAVMEHFGLEELLTAVSNLDYGDRWHALARLALRDDMHGALRALTLKILEVSEPEETSAEKIAEWESSQSNRLSRVRSVLAEIEETGTPDLATLSVAARQLRSVIR